jgi:NADH dehydrogenase (ubiquinone) 1 alpha subcomplex subunit 6
VVPRRTLLCPVACARSAPFSPGRSPCSVPRLPILLAQAPHIVDLYSLNIAPNYIRAAMRRKFDEHRHVSDPRTVDMLLVKGQQEYQETMNQWKMPDQLLGIMLQPQGRPPRTFMQKFLEGACRALCYDDGLMCTGAGRDEDAALPAASGILRLP